MGFVNLCNEVHVHFHPVASRLIQIQTILSNMLENALALINMLKEMVKL